MSETWLWQLEARVRFSFQWSSIVDRLNRSTADATAEFYAKRYPEWTLRLHNKETGEVINLGPDGLPLQEAS